MKFSVFLFLYIGKGKKDEDWSDEGSDVDLKEVSDEEVAKPVSKKKSKFLLTYLLIKELVLHLMEALVDQWPGSLGILRENLARLLGTGPHGYFCK